MKKLTLGEIAGLTLTALLLLFGYILPYSPTAWATHLSEWSGVIPLREFGLVIVTFTAASIFFRLRSTKNSNLVATTTENEYTRVVNNLQDTLHNINNLIHKLFTDPADTFNPKASASLFYTFNGERGEGWRALYTHDNPGLSPAVIMDNDGWGRHILENKSTFNFLFDVSSQPTLYTLGQNDTLATAVTGESGSCIGLRISPTPQIEAVLFISVFGRKMVNNKLGLNDEHTTTQFLNAVLIPSFSPYFEKELKLLLKLQESDPTT